MALYQKHFYHSMIRNYVAAFGSLFTDLQVVRVDSLGNELGRQTVPLNFSKKQKFVQRLIQDANLDSKPAITLPRIAFEFNGISYAPQRKVPSVHRIKQSNPADGNSAFNVYNPLPYDIAFSLSIYAKRQDEALQILEQIIPFFSPQYTIKMKGIKSPDICYDVPISLVSVAPDDNAEGSFEDNRMIIWTLDFVMAAYMFGPIRNSGLIKTAITEFKDYDENTDATIQIQPYIDGVPLDDILKEDDYEFLVDIVEEI